MAAGDHLDMAWHLHTQWSEAEILVASIPFKSFRPHPSNTYEMSLVSSRRAAVMEMLTTFGDPAVALFPVSTRLTAYTTPPFTGSLLGITLSLHLSPIVYNLHQATSPTSTISPDNLLYHASHAFCPPHYLYQPYHGSTFSRP